MQRLWSRIPLALSCKRRHFCPSCHQKRVAEFGELTIYKDMSDFKNMEAQFLQAQKMESVGRLAGGGAHDYNNALSVIIGFTDLALNWVDPAGPLHKYLEEIQKAAGRATDITRQLLTFARKQTIAPKVFNLNERLNGLLQMVQRLLGEDVGLALLPNTSGGTVKMDPSQFDQIMINLCVNARDAISGVGKIIIETNEAVLDEAYCTDHPGSIPGDFVLLEVSDNGCGMEKGILDKIFEPFFTTKDMEKGTGLGLAAVYGIVKQNNGYVDVLSEPGKGTTFKIYLPRYEGKIDDIQEERKAEIPAGRGEMILLVEDDQSLLELCRKILGELGYTVLIAATPKEAAGLGEKHTGEIELLITDVIMPEMNGHELANQLQSSAPGLKYLFMSGHPADVIAHHGVLDDGINFIQKPFSKRDLAITVRKVIDE